VKAYNDDLRPALGLIRAHYPKRTSPLGKAITARLRDAGLQDVLDVIRWAAFSGDDRASFLRDGSYGLDTLLRPTKFQGYLDRSGVPEAPLPGTYVEPEAKEPQPVDLRIIPAEGYF